MRLAFLTASIFLPKISQLVRFVIVYNRVRDNMNIRSIKMAVQNLKNVKADRVLRLQTGLADLDWMHGRTDNSYGLPAGKISIWSGEKGIGKSRAAIEVARKVARRSDHNGHYRVLYFQTEASVAEFAGWVGEDGGSIPDTLYVSPSRDLQKQIKEIEQIRPNLVIVDSVTRLEQFGNTREKVDAIIDGVYENDVLVSKGYRHVCRADFIPHIILLCQLNKSGQTAGSSALPYAVDVEVNLAGEIKGQFAMWIEKNRHGKVSGYDESLTYIDWLHTEERCTVTSCHRQHDVEYCRHTGMEHLTIEQKVRRIPVAQAI